MINWIQKPIKLKKFKKLRFRSNNTGIGWFLSGSSLELSNIAKMKLNSNKTPKITLSKFSFIFRFDGGFCASQEFISYHISIAAIIPKVNRLLISQFIKSILLLAIITSTKGKTTKPNNQNALRFFPVEFKDKYLQINKGLNSKVTCINAVR